MGVVTVANAAACVLGVFRGDVLGLVRAPVSLLFGYWMGVGAWRRTHWGLRTVERAEVAPALDSGRTRRLIMLAVACSIALTLALAIQTVVGRA